MVPVPGEARGVEAHGLHGPPQKVPVLSHTAIVTPRSPLRQLEFLPVSHLEKRIAPGEALPGGRGRIRGFSERRAAKVRTIQVLMIQATRK